MSNISIPKRKKRSVVSHESDLKCDFSNTFYRYTNINSSLSKPEENYTFSWEIINGSSHEIISDTTGSSIKVIKDLNKVLNEVYKNKIKSSIYKLKIISKEGKVNTFFYDVSKSSSYDSTAIDDQKQVTANYCLKNSITSSAPYHTIRFLDDFNDYPTFDDLYNLCCPDSIIKNTSDLSNIETEYRAARDIYIREAASKIEHETNQPPGEYIFNPDYTNLLNKSSSSVTNRGNFKQVNFFCGIKVHKLEQACSLQLEELGNQSVYDIIGDAEIIFLGSLGSIEQLPITGSAGHVYSIENQGYAWHPLENSWSIQLGEVLENMATERRAKRAALLKSFNDLMLSTTPFLGAAYYLPLHKIK